MKRRIHVRHMRRIVYMPHYGETAPGPPLGILAEVFKSERPNVFC
jgi:hypothetical protein